MLVKLFLKINFLKILKITSRYISTCYSENNKKNKKENDSLKRGKVYIRSTNRNIFCTLQDADNNKIITSCSLRVPQYNNEFNEREKPYNRGLLLGDLFGNKILDCGYTTLAIFLDSGFNKGRNGVVRGLGNKKFTISFIRLSKGYPHNGCRPSKVRRKKLRTKQKFK